jgi:hypothetical protein
VAGVVVGLLGAPVSAGAGEVVVAPSEVIPGGITRIIVHGACEEAEGEIGGRPLRFFRAHPGGPLLALAGVDLDVSPGPQGATVRCGEQVLRTSVQIRAHTFPREELTVASRFVRPSPAEQARAAAEAARLKRLWASASPERLWRGQFQRPAPGPLGAAFGLRRIFNGEPRSPHNGIDIRAPRGTLVVAANRGRVALRDDLFFSGNTIVLDHGLGLYTLYLHLSEFRVGTGELVTRGQEIGRVGATGRVTGPHLHFSARLWGARVEPWQLITQDFGQAEGASADVLNTVNEMGKANATNPTAESGCGGATNIRTGEHDGGRNRKAGI